MRRILRDPAHRECIDWLLVLNSTHDPFVRLLYAL
jgi:hypothetical protein